MFLHCVKNPVVDSNISSLGLPRDQNEQTLLVLLTAAKAACLTIIGFILTQAETFIFIHIALQQEATEVTL